MKKSKVFLSLISILAILFVLLYDALYIVNQTQYALVLQFGEAVGTKLTPGLKIKIPFIQKIVFFDNRLQNISFESDDSKEMVASDQKTMRLDAFAKYKVIDPLKFYQAVHNERVLKLRLGSIIESVIREIIGSSQFIDVLSEERDGIMKKVTLTSREQAKRFGVEIVDVRMTKLFLPEKARNAVYDRMRTDREKEAMKIRSSGFEKARVIKAEADKNRAIMLADAQRESDIIKGRGEAEVTKILSKSYGQDYEFFSFYRSMQAYKVALDPSNTTSIISSDNPFLSYMKKTSE